MRGARWKRERESERKEEVTSRQDAHSFEGLFDVLGLVSQATLPLSCPACLLSPLEKLFVWQTSAFEKQVFVSHVTPRTIAVKRPRYDLPGAGRSLSTSTFLLLKSENTFDRNQIVCLFGNILCCVSLSNRSTHCSVFN